MRESVIHRPLGAVRFVDAASNAPITAGLRLGGATRVTWRRNASGAYVLWRARGVGLDASTGDAPDTTDAALEQLFMASPTPPVPESTPLTFTVEDPSGAFSPRTFVLPLPRADARAIRLYRTTAAGPVGAGTRIYALVHAAGDPASRVPGALVTVRIGSVEVGRGTTGANGEALVEHLALASFFTGDDVEVITNSVKATVAATVSLDFTHKDGGRWALKAFPDPDHFTGVVYAATPAEVSLSAGRVANASLPVALP